MALVIGPPSSFQKRNLSLRTLKMRKNDELEFMSIPQDDDDFNSMNISQNHEPDNVESVIGNAFLNKSKVGYFVLLSCLTLISNAYIFLRFSVLVCPLYFIICADDCQHPFALIFHLLFKGIALFMYLFGSWFTSNFIFIFVICIILLAFDFWTVKNVSGRLLVGLRWWSIVKSDGSNEWQFESLEDMAEISSFDSRIFWGALYISPICWAVLLFLATLRLKLEYIPVICAGLGLNMANVIGYVKCSSSAKERMQSMMEMGMKHTSMAALENSSFRNWLLSLVLSAPATTAVAAVAGNGSNSDPN